MATTAAVGHPRRTGPFTVGGQWPSGLGQSAADRLGQSVVTRRLLPKSGTRRPPSPAAADTLPLKYVKAIQGLRLLARPFAAQLC